MADIIEIMKNIPDLSGIKGANDAQIKLAEDELGLKFPEEYKEYVREFGCIDFGPVEWTGLNIEGRLNTVTATKKEKGVNPDFPEGWFVLEELGIDAKNIIVNSEGKVALIQYENITPIFDSISEYLMDCIKQLEAEE